MDHRSSVPSALLKYLPPRSKTSHWAPVHQGGFTDYDQYFLSYQVQQVYDTVHSPDAHNLGIVLTTRETKRESYKYDKLFPHRVRRTIRVRPGRAN